MFNGFVILLIAIFISLHKYIDVLYDKKEIQKDFNTLSSRMNRDDGQWICEHHFILWDIHAPLAWKHQILYPILTKIYFQIFYIYMYLVSFLFVVYVHFCILKRGSRLTMLLVTIVRHVRRLLRNDSNKEPTEGRAGAEPSALSRRSLSTNSTCNGFVYTGSFPFRIGAVGKSRFIIFVEYRFLSFLWMCQKTTFHSHWE